MRDYETNIGGEGGARVAPLFVHSQQPTATPIELLTTRTADGGIGLSFGYAALQATEYAEVKRLAETPLSEDEIHFPELIDDPIKKRWAEELSKVTDDVELSVVGRMAPQDELDSEETIGHNVELLVEEAKAKAKAVLKLGGESDIKRDPLEWIPEATDKRWKIKSGTIPLRRVSNDLTNIKVIVGDQGHEGKTLESVDPLTPHYEGLKNLREAIVHDSQVTKWIMRDDHPWYRWRLLERKVEHGVNLILFGLLANPDEMEEAGFSPYIADSEKLKAARVALRRMYSSQNPNGYEAPSPEETQGVIGYTIRQLRQNPVEPIPENVISPFIELQNLSTTTKLRLPSEFPALRGTLFALETRTIQDTGGPNSAKSLATGPDAFEAVVAGAISTLRLSANYLSRISMTTAAYDLRDVA